MPKESAWRLVVVNDFLEDYGTYRITSVRSLSNPARTCQLASQLRKRHGFARSGVPLCLGRLESSDFAPLSARRKEAVQAFWTSYFAAWGKPAEIQFDGTGILADVEHGCFGGKQ
jgi:hypothetical protein